MTYRSFLSAPGADMTPLEDFIGQERAMRAIQFGLDGQTGIQYFRHGLTGTGKNHHQAFLKKITAERICRCRPPFPRIGAYVYNFNDPDRPQVLKIHRGWGKRLADMEKLIENLQREAKEDVRK